MKPRIPRPNRRNRHPELLRRWAKQCNFSTAPDATSRSAVVFSSFPRKRPRLTPLHLKGTASILTPSWRHLAPCLGGALACSPVAGNLMRIGDASPHAMVSDHHREVSATAREVAGASQLASLLFFQLIRESPRHVARNKSLPAAYLTPSLMGSLLGLSIANPLPTSASKDSDAFRENIRQRLREKHGIKSNYIHHNEWTGVSLSRWMDLIPRASSTRFAKGDGPPPLLSSVWLIALWELSNSKDDFLDFFIALEDELTNDSRQSETDSHTRVLDTNNPLVQAILNDPVARKEWANDCFDDTNDLSTDSVQAAMDRLLRGCENRAGISRDDADWARALEVVCAARTMEQLPVSGKPACPNGYYGYDDGDAKADCAEVMTREIMDFLLWDEARGEFDTSRIPQTTKASSSCIMDLYDPTLPGHESGAAWFSSLSNLPECDYLAKSPNNRPYELAPTIRNISRALQHLLIPATANNGDGDGLDPATRPWTSLKDLASAWSTDRLVVHEETLTHRSSTTGELMHHEFATLRRDGVPSGMELRLRCDWDNQSGMAAVTHLRVQEALFGTRQIQELAEPQNDSVLQTLSLALISDMGLRNLAGDKGVGASGEGAKCYLVLSLLSSYYGCDRRGILSLGSVAQDEQIRQDLHQSEKVLETAIAEACLVSGVDKRLGTNLLAWLLSETPTVDETSFNIHSGIDAEIEAMILSLSPDVLTDPDILIALQGSPACRSPALRAWATWKYGIASFPLALSHLRPMDLASFLILLFTKSSTQ